MRKPVTEEGLIDDLDYCFEISLDNMFGMMEATLECQMEGGSWLYSEADKEVFYKKADERIEQLIKANRKLEIK